MKDIDFEELDKAVSALVSGGPSGSPKNPEPDNEPGNAKALTPAKRDTSKAVSVAVSRTSQAKANERPIGVTSAASEPKRTVAPSPIKRPAPAVPARGSGSFMDIVATKPDKPSGSRAPLPSRNGLTIKPVSDDKTLRDAAVSSTRAAPAEKPTPGVTAAEFLSDDEDKWPDPIDFSDTASAKPSPAGKPASDPEETADTASPFLTDAKVEKRPLGAFAAKPEDAPTRTYELPDELKPDTAQSEAIEPETSGTAHTPEPAASDTPAPAEPTAIAAPTKQDLHDKAMLSIPQQYKTAEVTADKAERPVFDTKEYHPPLLEETAHGGHKKSGIWNKLFIVLLIIALLAVGAYFAFVYFVQMQP